MNPTILFGIIRHALTFGAGFIAAKGWINAGDVPQVVSAAMTLAGVCWSIYEKIEMPGGPGTPTTTTAASAPTAGIGIPPGAATALIAAGLGGLMLTMSGCTASGTTGNSSVSVLSQDPTTQVAIIAQVAQAGTQLGVAAAITQQPALRQYFEASREALNALLATGNTAAAGNLTTTTAMTNPTQLQSYLNQSVPAAYQPLVDAGLNAAIGAYTTWYNANASKLTTSDTAKYSLQILTAIDAGLNAALGPIPVPMPAATVVHS
ncbi:MAG: hypothetical protein ABSH19_06485 [Opitutales bacterium]|jgi:hypothetical protein